VILAVTCVPTLSIVTVPAVIPLPKSTLVTPLIKSIPVTTTLRVCPTVPMTGVTLVAVGEGFRTSNAFASVADPPPGAVFAIVMSRKPNAASLATRKLPVIWVVPTNVAETNVRPETGKAVVTDGMKPVPLIVTFTSFPLAPTPGTTLVIVGAGLITEKPPERVTAPLKPPEFDTETSRTPVDAAYEIEASALIWVALRTVTESRVISGPISMVVAPEEKLEPVQRILNVCPRAPIAGEMPVNVGTGRTENPELSVAVPPPGDGFVTTTERGPRVAPGAIEIDATSS
jgi:hypothetical protein